MFQNKMTNIPILSILYPAQERSELKAVGTRNKKNVSLGLVRGLTLFRVTFVTLLNSFLRSVSVTNVTLPKKQRVINMPISPIKLGQKRNNFCHNFLGQVTVFKPIFSSQGSKAKAKLHCAHWNDYYLNFSRIIFFLFLVLFFVEVI